MCPASSSRNGVAGKAPMSTLKAGMFGRERLVYDHAAAVQASHHEISKYYEYQQSAFQTSATSHSARLLMCSLRSDISGRRRLSPRCYCSSPVLQASWIKTAADLDCTLVGKLPVQHLVRAPVTVRKRGVCLAACPLSSAPGTLYDT